MDATSQIEDTSMGLMKALHFITTQQQRRAVKQKFKYETIGQTFRATRCLKKLERAQITLLAQKLVRLDRKTQQDEISDIMKEMGKHPVAFVPVKREFKIDYSKTYPYRSKKRGG